MLQINISFSNEHMFLILFSLGPPAPKLISTREYTSIRITLMKIQKSTRLNYLRVKILTFSFV